MAYTDDTVRSRLSSLNDTQESIVTMAQWIMFHRKHAERSAALWLERMHESGSGKRLTLIYLVNEVVQQSKARKKDDFLVAFSPIIVDATIAAYKSASGDTQNRLRRVVDVWRQRSIFDASIQSTLEAQMNEIDKSAGGSGSGGRKTLMGGSLFSSSSVPTELETLVKHQQQLSKMSGSFETAVKTASTEYTTMTDPQRVPPTQPVHARQLGLLMQKLSVAETAVTKSLESRKSIISELEKLLEANRQALTPLEDQQKEFAEQKTEIAAKHAEVEDQIMKGLPPADNGSNGGYGFDEDRRPQEEPLTPPPVESFTPPDEPAQHPLDPPPLNLYPEMEEKTDTPNADLTSLSSVIDPRKSRARPASATSPPPVVKRRKPSGEDDEIPGFSNGDALEGLDADVVGMLK